MTNQLQRPGGSIAYEVTGPEAGPLVVCAPGMGDLRSEYRYLAPALASAGYRVALMDLRGHGESSASFTEYSPASVGADMLALARELAKGEVRLVGTSMAAAAAVWAAAEAPDLISSIVLIGPFVRDVPTTAFERGLFKAALLPLWGRKVWASYYRSLYPTAPPGDLDDHVKRLRANLSEAGRFEALRAMAFAPKQPCEARIPEVRARTLVVMGTKDPDFHSPEAEAKEVAQRLNADTALVEAAGHYPHVEFPDIVAPRITSFLKGARA